MHLRPVGAACDFQAIIDRLCGLVVRAEGPGSIPGATRNSRSGTGSTQPREYN
jgi:hypothetical protein